MENRGLTRRDIELFIGIRARFAELLNRMRLLSFYTASLIPRKIYEVIPDEDAEKDDHLRVVDESGKDYLLPHTSTASHRAFIKNTVSA